jgi:CRISPR/Cas system endoribonuclease Cas6 (RAMP superfamily)
LLETVRIHVGISVCHGGTETVLLEAKRRFIGFVGAVTFCVLKPEVVTSEEKAALAALVRFSNYCGTGVETTRGMGQTRVGMVGDEWHAGPRRADGGLV